MEKSGRETVRKEEIAEDWCFVCKEGGDLLICDYRQCLKAYHSHCIGKDDSFLTSEECWNCSWHYCFVCKKASSFHCHCCPKAVCRKCINSAEFVVVKGKYGFCSNCLKLALMVEENMDVDSDGETVDFKDLKTHEGLFKDYYDKVIKEEKSFTLDNLRDAKARLSTGKSDSDDFVGDIDDETESDYESKDEMEDFKMERKKEFKGKLNLKPKNVKSKKMEFTGWGSTPLIEFLGSIGQDTSKEIHQHRVETLINAYIQEHKLFHPEKKRKITCDEKLRALFGRKVVNRSRIYSLLEAHFVSNLEESEEEDEVDDMTCNSEDKDEDAAVSCTMKRKSKKEKGSLKKEPVLSAPQSRFASLCAENIRLVYLRKSLLQELSKEPESFQNKVIGSFVRVKTDPNDYSQKNSHQLLQVTGAKINSTGENNAEIILHVLSMPEIRMISLSDADFEEAECEDLRQKVKDGLIQKPTVVDLQEKARNLHKDITKNWIARELKLLDLRIDLANEKGRRQEWNEYMEKRKLLGRQTEQSRLLETYPTVVPEEPEPTVGETVHKIKWNEASSQSVLPTDLSNKWGGDGTSRNKKYPSDVSSQDEKQNLVAESVQASTNQTSAEKSKKTLSVTLEGSPTQLPPESQYALRFRGNDETCILSTSGTKRNRGADNEDTTTSKKQEPLVDKAVVDSSSGNALRKPALEDPNSRVWLILGPKGERNGTRYSLALLKAWSEASSYALKYKAWKETETEEQAIWLGDAIKLAFVG